MATGRTAAFAAALLACCFAASVRAQTFNEYPTPTNASFPWGITLGPDGNLWFTENHASKIGRITPAGAISEFNLPTGGGDPYDIVTGPDGALWFTERSANKIGRITTAGVVSEFPVAAANAKSLPSGITSAPDGALWFTEYDGNNIGRMATDGSIMRFPLPNPGSQPVGIAVGPDGALWFTELLAARIGRITMAGNITEYAIGGSAAGPIALGPDGAMWFTESDRIGKITSAGTVTEFPAINSFTQGITAGPEGAVWITYGLLNTIVGITTNGAITAYTVPTSGSQPIRIVSGPDGALWFAESISSKIGRFSPPPASPLLAAVLPASRSVQAGPSATVATAFGTIINTTANPLTACGIAPATSIPATFSYQTTNPATNALTGSPNTPVGIAANGSQSFVFAFTPTAAFGPTDVVLDFSCSGTPPALTVVGLNTLLLSASNAPVPDIVALGATTTNDQILHINGPGGSAAFAVATANVGASGAIRVFPVAANVLSGLVLSVCQTNPATGQCASTVSSFVDITINTNATPTFAIFATAGGTIGNIPALNRIFVNFKDGSGVTRGSTSVAVVTQ